MSMKLFGISVSFVPGYRGHNGGLFDRGPNWAQVTVPPSRKKKRAALIVSWEIGET